MSLRRLGARSGWRRPPPRRPHRPLLRAGSGRRPNTSRAGRRSSNFPIEPFDNSAKPRPEDPLTAREHQDNRAAPAPFAMRTARRIHRSGGRLLMSAGSDLRARMAGRPNVADYGEKPPHGGLAGY